ncbi:MAG: hypothetical protein ACE5GB_08080 [Acidimicrobiales bacterium]
MRSRTIRVLALLMAVSLVAAACGDDDDGGSSASGSDDAAADTGGSDDATTTAAPTTTAAIPEGGSPLDGVHVTRVVFGAEGSVTLTNTGDEQVVLDGLWLCNRPSYSPLGGTLGAGETIEISAGVLGDLPADGGEVALYTSNSFGDSSALIDYVEWGSGGGRESVAVGAERGVEGVTVQPMADPIELLGVAGDPESWG